MTISKKIMNGKNLIANGKNEEFSAQSPSFNFHAKKKGGEG